MQTRNLPPPVASLAALAVRRHVGPLRDAWASLRRRWVQAQGLRRAERELAQMSLHGLRDIGAPEVLQDRRRQEQASMHLRL